MEKNVGVRRIELRLSAYHLGMLTTWSTKLFRMECTRLLRQRHVALDKKDFARVHRLAHNGQRKGAKVHTMDKTLQNKNAWVKKIFMKTTKAGVMREIIKDKSDVTFFLHSHPKALFSSQKILQNFSNFPSHRIFRRMHGVLNIDENKKTNYTVRSKLTRRIFWI